MWPNKTPRPYDEHARANGLKNSVRLAVIIARKQPPELLKAPFAPKC
jgi:hypothetical protein